MTAEAGLPYVDLHTHTTASDGVLPPEQVVDAAAAAGLKAIAITDHDSTNGIEEAMAEAEFLGIMVIPGIEMSTDMPRAEVHVLGYFLDYHDQEFQHILEELRDGRRERAERIVEKLAGMGMNISWERVQKVAGEGSVGRPHIAQVMVETGYVSYLAEACSNFIGRNAPADAERSKRTRVESVSLGRRWTM